MKYPVNTNTPDTLGRTRASLQVFTMNKLTLVDTVPMLQSKHAEAVSWLKQWTPPNNFQAIIAASAEEAIEIFRQELKDTLVLHLFPPQNFVFDLGQMDVYETGNVLRFWCPGSGPVRRMGYTQIPVSLHKETTR